MPLPARIRNTLAVLALAAPVTPVLAQSPAESSIPMPAAAPTLSPAPGYDSAPAMDPSAAPAAHKHRWSLLHGRRHCPECRRADVMRRTGLNVPPAPPLPGAMVNRGACADCGQPVMVANARPMMPGPGGYAATVNDEAPGLASVGDMSPGAGPMPVGTFNESLVHSAPGIASTGPKSPTDDSLMRTAGMASDPVSPHAHNRPHIISHLLGLDALSIEANEREDKRKRTHASMTYGPTNVNVTELPTKMVYGK